MSDPPRSTAGPKPVLTSRGRGLTRRAALAGALQALALLAACTNLPAPVLTEHAPQPGGEPTPLPAVTPVAPDTACMARLPAAVAPTPLPFPGYAQMEPETGLHVTARPQVLDLAAYRLEVTGKVERPLSLTFDELRCLPRTEAEVTLDCPGAFVDHETLAGTPLAGVLALAGPQSDAQTIRFRTVDGHDRSFSLAEGQAPENFLAYELNGQPLPASHGFPLRVVLPGRAGDGWVKWLVGIEVA